MVKIPSSSLPAPSNLDKIYDRIASFLHGSRNSIYRSVNAEMLKAYWLVGREIVEEEQQGESKAEYGSYLLETISARLTKEFGKGFGVSNLKYMRQFYLVYAATPIRHAARGELGIPAFSPNLSWTHYRLLMRIESPEIRAFYEIEAAQNYWSSRELERQINSLLFERLAKSRDKEGMLALVHKGQEVINPSDAIKDPMVFEFLGV